MTEDYSGSAELLNAKGELIDEVRVFLRYTQNPNGLGEWGGQIEPSNIGPDWMEATQIRLPSGDIAACIISNVEYSSSGSQSGWLVGSGAPPFGTKKGES